MTTVPPISDIENKESSITSFDEEATKMVHQAVVDYLATLPPAARAASELYFRSVLPRCRVVVFKDS